MREVAGKPYLWVISRARGGNWIAVCDPLGLTLQSETYANLMEDIDQTLDAIMNDLLATRKLRENVRERLKEKKRELRRGTVTPAPRYDEVFLDGLEWLDELAGGVVDPRRY